MVGRLIDRYIIIRDYISVSDNECKNSPRSFPLEDASFYEQNHHCKRIEKEHSYCSPRQLESGSRNLPMWMVQQQTSPYIPKIAKRDGVFSYACAVMCDGLLLLQLRDAIHQGDGLRCWKFLLLYFKSLSITNTQ